MTWKTESKISSIKEQLVDRFAGANEEVFTNQKSMIQEAGNITEYITIFFMSDLNLDENDLDAEKMQIFAETGGAFDFLNDPAEKSYSESDGEPL